MKKILALSGLVVIAGHAMALSQLTSRAQIPLQSTVDWQSMGSEGFIAADPSFVTSSGQPVIVKVDGPGSDMLRLDQGSGWSGNFASGAHLLFTDFADGAVRLKFSKTLSDFGTQVQRNEFGNFTAKITAYDGLDTNLGSFTVNGDSNWFGDDSAVFVGVHSSGNDISYIDLEVSPGSGWAMNDLSMACCNTNSVPEPFTMGVLGIGSLVALRRKSKKA